jgi:GNAT superfamily N-acetyltransferase
MRTRTPRFSGLREIVLPDEEVWVAEMDGEPVGFAALGSREGEVYLQHLYVLPEQQRRGLGGELMDHAKKQRPTASNSGSFSGTRAPAASTRSTAFAPSS